MRELLQEQGIRGMLVGQVAGTKLIWGSDAVIHFRQLDIVGQPRGVFVDLSVEVCFISSNSFSLFQVCSSPEGEL